MFYKAKEIFLAVVLFIFAQPLMAIPPIAGDDAAIARLNALLENTHSFKANFTQKLSKPKSNTVKEYKGRFALERPNRFNWEIISPDKQFLVADGNQLWFYDVDLEQVTVTPIQEAIGSTPAALLSSRTIDVEKQFYVNQVVNTDKEQRFELNPRSSDQLISEIQIVFIDKVLSSMLFVDTTGQRSEITFTDAQMNPNLPASLFVFKKPAGVDVIGKPKKTK